MKIRPDHGESVSKQSTFSNGFHRVPRRRGNSLVDNRAHSMEIERLHCHYFDPGPLVYRRLYILSKGT